MTTEAIEVRLLLSGIGEDELVDALLTSDVDLFIQRLGMRGLNYAIAKTIARFYPADIFPPADKISSLDWRADLDYGPGVDPGVKWIALLRRALEEVNGAAE